VLFIDCLPDEQEMYGDALRHAGIEPVMVCDGSSAFERAVSTRARVIVIDLTPRDGGLDLIRRFRGDSRTRASTIIAVSAHVFPADRAAAEHAGCDVFLSKPCPPDTLVDEVRYALTRLKSERASEMCACHGIIQQRRDRNQTVPQLSLRRTGVSDSRTSSSNRGWRSPRDL